jgi:hypothetical protein
VNEAQSRSPAAQSRPHAPDVPPGALSPVSATTLNTLKLVTDPENRHISTQDEVTPETMPGDLESAAPEADITEISEKADVVAAPSTSFSRSIGAYTPLQSTMDSPPMMRAGAGVVSPTVRNISAEFGPLRSFSNFSIAEDSTANNSPPTQQQSWSSAVGKANLGKSGRVIEKLMAENDMLKRELQIMKLAAAQAKEDVKNADARMESLSGEYEARLHDAEITKALLKKRDRQVAELKVQIESERDRADAAVESERNWKAEMERMDHETKAKLIESNTHVALVDKRYDTLQSHWKEQGALVDAQVANMQQQTALILEERLEDLRRMQLLQELVDQKDLELSKLQDINKSLNDTIEAYRAEQDASLHNIRVKAKGAQQLCETVLKESQEVLGEMRWTIAVNKNLRDRGLPSARE